MFGAILIVQLIHPNGIRFGGSELFFSIVTDIIRGHHYKLFFTEFDFSPSQFKVTVPPVSGITIFFGSCNIANKPNLYNAIPQNFLYLCTYTEIVFRIRGAIFYLFQT